MKGGVISAIITFLQTQHHKDVVLSIVGDEEIGGQNGTNYLVNEHNLWGEYAFIYEPTNLNVSLGQKSGMFVRLSYRGYQGHGAYPHRGPNALLVFYEYWKALEKEFNLKKIRTDDDAFDSVTITPSYLKVGNRKNKNVVPGRLEGYLDVRFPPTIDVETIQSKLDSLARRFGIHLHFHYVGKGWRLKVGGDLYNAVVNTYLQIFKAHPTFIKKMGTNDGRYYAEKGSQIVNLGPGDNKLSHSDKEWVDIKDVVKVADFYSALIDSLP